MSGRWKGEKQLQVQQRGRPMPFTEEQMRQIYNTNIIDFAVRNGFEIEKSDKATVHVKHNGGLYLFKHGRGYYSFTEERGGDIVEFAMNYLGPALHLLCKYESSMPTEVSKLYRPIAAG